MSFRVVPSVFPLFFPTCAPVYSWMVWCGHRLVSRHLGNHPGWLYYPHSLFPAPRCCPETRMPALCSKEIPKTFLDLRSKYDYLQKRILWFGKKFTKIGYYNKIPPTWPEYALKSDHLDLSPHSQTFKLILATSLKLSMSQLSLLSKKGIIILSISCKSGEDTKVFHNA